MTSHHRVVYTSVFGGYDLVHKVNSNWDCDFICFTDDPNCVGDGWDIVVVNLDGELPSVVNRRYKMLPHIYLSNYTESLYVDGSIYIVNNPSPLFDRYLINNKVCAPKHYERSCAYDEIIRCVECGLVTNVEAENQTNRYLRNGFPRGFGMTENGVLLRQHKDEMVIKLMNTWWKEYCTGIKRDQISLPYVSWNLDVEVYQMSESARNNNQYFRMAHHNFEKRISILGQVVDYIGCNKHRNFFYKYLHAVINSFNKIKLLRRLVK